VIRLLDGIQTRGGVYFVDFQLGFLDLLLTALYSGILRDGRAPPESLLYSIQVAEVACRSGLFSVNFKYTGG
jgi:hypothetical protein